jgi:putative YhdH/YhfP family quinone oxidoreductase
MSETFTAWLATKNEDGGYAVALSRLTTEDLPPEGVLVDVSHSTVNYKDALAMTAKGKIIRRFPMVLGADLAGTVRESADEVWKPGDRVLVNGFGMSEVAWGGYTQKARVKPEWLVRIPDAFTTAQAMAIGTAGYTAMLCVMALEDAGVKPDGREVLVTGAAGGVGSVAISLLAKLGYTVTAATGRPGTHDYLRSLGASNFVSREELAAPSGPLQKERWAGVVDSVGSTTLASALAATAYRGAVAACGLAGGMDLPTTVAPFILRGVRLIGIDSVMAPQALRQEAWSRLARDLDIEKLSDISTEVAMADVPRVAEDLIAGKVRGRVVVRTE